MIGSSLTLNILQKRKEKLDDRRRFFRKTGGFAVGMAGGAVLVACGGNSDDANAQTKPNIDNDILNFALNLEYLEAQFYSYAVTGQGLAQSLLTGTGTQGAVIPGHAVPFTDPVVQQYANEIAADELAHVKFLRSVLTTAAVSSPVIDVGFTDPNGAFSSAARAAGLVGPGVAFDPYKDDNSFLLGAFIFEDVGVTAYKGASPLITSPIYLEAAAGILAAEAYHAALVRTVLYAKGLATPSLRTSADAISNARDSLDGGTVADDDQGISPIGSGATTQSNIVPLDANGLAFSRTADNVLNIVYLTALAASKGGFFPNGVNGNIFMSSAN